MKDILAISGYSGLFKLISSTKNGVLVENVETKKRMPAFATSKISSMGDIAIFCNDGTDMPLVDVFKAIRAKENGGAAVSAKSDDKTLKSYFLEAMPNYDQDRVYVSHIKKVLTWYNILQANNLLSELDKDDEVAAEAEQAKVEEAPVAEEKPKAKKTAAKKSAKKSEE
ncbi:MAG: DUF5606 domain-containing protein [Salinivirgaceae bacterium]|nr:DUF5606 domain-containing protein [Salinivirgaceae bacterium]